MTNIFTKYQRIFVSKMHYFLLLIILILFIWGFNLFFQAEDHELLFLNYYKLSDLVISLILGIIIFFIVQKVRFRINYLHTMIWLLFGTILGIASYLLAYDSNKTDGDLSYLVYPFWRTGQWITFSLIIYAAYRFENLVKERMWERIIITAYMIFGNLAILALHDLYGSIIFTVISAIGMGLLRRKTLAISILLLNVILIFMFVKDYRIAPVRELHIPSLTESHLAGCALHDSPFFLGEGPYNYYFEFDKSPHPIFHKGDMVYFIRLQYGYWGIFLLLLLYSVLIYLAVYSAKKARDKSHAVALILLTVMFTMFTLAGIATCFNIIPYNSEGLPFLNASNSKQIFSFILAATVYKELRSNFKVSQFE